jgi:hypothetical protein
VQVESYCAGERVLPRDRAFVVQLAGPAAGTPEDFWGRVEHVASGQARHFHTLADCLAFMARVVRERQARQAEEA